MIFLFLFLVVLGIGVTYLVSAAARARRKANAAVNHLKGLEQEIAQAHQQTKAAVAKAAKAYVDDVRYQRLRAIGVDELKRHASGLRLQALKDAGLRDFSQLRGWNAQRLVQLKGIGPDSASRIATIVETLCHQSDQQPIPHPSEGPITNSGYKVFEAIHIATLVQITFQAPSSQLQDVLKEFQWRRYQVLDSTGFFAWLPSFGHSAKIDAAAAAADAMEADLKHTHQASGLSRGLKHDLDRLSRMAREGVEARVLDQDVKSNADGYQRAFNEIFGTRGASLPQGKGLGQFTHQPPPLPQSRPSQSIGSPIQISISMVGPGGMRISTSEGHASKPTSQNPKPFWVPPGQDITVDQYVIPGGMVYVGTGLESVQGYGIEPALIDPKRQVRKQGGDYRIRQTNYWPNYDGISPEARASYLNWLAGGKSDPAADLGYVFLYFYGLERRILADAANDSRVAAELPLLEAEIRRLLSIFGTSGSFRGYASSLLDYLSAKQTSQITLDAPPTFSGQRGLSLAFKATLGGFAAKGSALPAPWAHAWYMHDPNNQLRSAAQRCPKEFQQVFLQEYANRFGPGLKLSLNKTKLKVVHRTASASFGSQGFSVDLDLPDVTVQSAPVTQLQEVGEAAYRKLDAYSRFLGRTPEKANTLEAVLLLPPTLWPSELRDPLDALRNSIKGLGRPKIVSFLDVQLCLPEGGELNRARYTALCQAFAELGLGIEPDARFGGQVPSLEDRIALFEADPVDASKQPSSGYAFASLALHLASAVAHSDGEFGKSEQETLLGQLESWMHLPNGERARLKAQLELFQTAAPSLTGLKKRIDGLSVEQREALAELLALTAHADGVVSPAEVKALEKIFKLMGLDPQSVYSKLHQAAPTEPVTVRPAESEAEPFRIPQKAQPASIGGIKIDMAKVEALKSESAKVSALLGAIFSGQATETPIPPEPAIEQAKPNLLGLDDAHADLLRVLLSRPVWERAELEDICSDRGLMTDGAIERINEAAFDQLDEAILEGEDPIEVHRHLIEEAA